MRFMIHAVAVMLALSGCEIVVAESQNPTTSGTSGSGSASGSSSGSTSGSYGRVCTTGRDCDPDGYCQGLVECTAGICSPPSFDNLRAQPGTPCGTCGKGYCGGGSADAGPICQLTSCGCESALPDGGQGFLLDPTHGIQCNGPELSDTLSNACRTDCQPAHCGDGVVDTGEVCDLGAIVNGTGVGCNDTCNLVGQVTTIAGNGHAGLADGFGTSAKFGQPYGITIEDGGDVLYVADISFRALRAIYLSNNDYVQTLAGGWDSGGKFDGDGPATDPNAGFYEPLALMPFDGGLIVTDYGALRFYAFSPTFDGGTLATLAGARATNDTPQAGFDAGPFNDCVYGEPRGICQVGMDIYTNTTIDGWLAMSDLTTDLLSSDGALGPIVQQGGVATLGGLVYTADAADPGDLYVYDPNNPSNGVAPLGLTLHAPDGICSDYQSSLYICETQTNIVKQYNVTTGRLSTVAGGGSVVFPEQDGIGSQASFFDPAGCVFDPQTNTLYVTDKAGNTIRRIQ